MNTKSSERMTCCESLGSNTYQQQIYSSKQSIPYSSPQQICEVTKKCLTPTLPPCSPPPCPPIIRKSNAQVGIKGPVTTGGPTGTFPCDTIYVANGGNITGVNPILLRGQHTYLVEWSLSADLVDIDGALQVELLLDGNVVSGSGNYESITAEVDGFIPLSGGAIINVPGGTHTLQLRYVAGSSGLVSREVNLRIIELN